MALNKKQKKYISKNNRNLSVEQIANNLGVSQNEITDYLKKLGKETVDEKIAAAVDLSFWKIVKNNWKYILFLSIAVISIYFNSLHGAFVSDDYASISENPQVTNLGVMSEQLGLPAWSNWFMAILFGSKSPIPYHSLNLLMYVTICILAFVFLALLFEQKIAVISTIIFAFLPIHVEAISWISGKPYLFNGLFVLATLITTLLYIKTNRKKYLWITIGLIPLLFLADKVRSFSYLLIFILILISFGKEIKVNINWKKLVTFVSITVIAALIFLWPRILDRINSVNSGYNTSESIFYNPFFQYPTAIPKYLQLILFPTDLTLYHTMYIFPSWLNWIVTLAYFGTLAYFFFKDKRLFFGMAFILLAAAPSMSPVKVSWLVAERYMFLGSLGMAVVLGVIFLEMWKINRLAAISPLLVLLAWYSVLIYKRNIDWQTNHNLWVRTVQVSPNSHNAWNNIGDDYDKLAQYENAIKGFTQSTVVKPNYADAFHNRANIFYKIGRLDMARDSYETALKFSPGLYQTYISLIQMDLTERKPVLALDHVNKLVTIQPNNPQSYYIRAVVVAQLGMYDDALKDLNRILAVDPNNKQAKDLLIKINTLKNNGTNQKQN